MTHGDIGKVLLRMFRNAFGKNVHDPVIETQQALADGEPYGRGGKGLAHRHHEMGGIGSYLSFCHDFSMLDHHYGMKVLSRFIHGLDI